MSPVLVKTNSNQIYPMTGKIGQIVIAPDTLGRRRSHTYIQCAHCDKVFLKPTRFINNNRKSNLAHYCGVKCQIEGQKNRVELVCPVCKKKFCRVVGRVRDKSFCSRKCKDLAQTASIGILNCGKPISAYRTIAFATYPHKCAWCENSLVEVLEVHHIDSNHNNQPDNLIILCPICHALVTRNFVAVVDRKPVLLADSETIKHHFQNIEHLIESTKQEFMSAEDLGEGRPSKGELVDMLTEHTIVDIGEKYGVSGTAVAGWCRKLGVNRPGVGYWQNPDNRKRLKRF